MLPDTTRIGAARLRVRDPERALAFYRDLLGLRALEQNYSTITLSAAGKPPALLILDADPDAIPKPPRTTGLYHVAIRLPSRSALARVLRRLIVDRYPLQGASDHLVSEALYLADPDGNGLELYCDRPRDQWRWEGGMIAMATDPLDVDDLLARAGSAPWDGIDPGTDIGHVHLHVSSLERAETFYSDLLGFEVMQRSYPGALFVAAGGYHHHIGLNVWAGRGAPPPPANAVGLVDFEVALPDTGSLESALDRLRAQQVAVEQRERGWVVSDGDANRVVLTGP